MTSDEIQQFLEKFDGSIQDFQSQVYYLRDSLEAVEDKLADCTRAFNEVPEDELNAILRSGFVPGVHFTIEEREKTYYFTGFTCGRRVRCLTADGIEQYTDISVIHKLFMDKKITILGMEGDK